MQTLDTREIIMRKSFELLLKKGFDGVSISDIKQATGFSRGLLYHYFGNKQAMFIEAIMLHFNELFELDMQKTESLRADQMIDYIIAKYCRLSDETLKEVSILNYDFLFYRAMRESAELTALYERVRDDELAAWRRALSNSLQQQRLRHDITDNRLPQLARQFVYATDGVWLRAVTPNVKIDLIDELRQALTSLYSLIKQ